jgi:hypothetical protein
MQAEFIILFILPREGGGCLFNIRVITVEDGLALGAERLDELDLQLLHVLLDLAGGLPRGGQAQDIDSQIMTNRKLI